MGWRQGGSVGGHQTNPFLRKNRDARMRNTAPPALFKETAGSVQCGFVVEGIHCNLPKNMFSLMRVSPYARVCLAC